MQSLSVQKSLKSTVLEKLFYANCIPEKKPNKEETAQTTKLHSKPNNLFKIMKPTQKKLARAWAGLQADLEGGVTLGGGEGRSAEVGSPTLLSPSLSTPQGLRSCRVGWEWTPPLPISMTPKRLQ